MAAVATEGEVDSGSRRATAKGREARGDIGRPSTGQRWRLRPWQWWTVATTVGWGEVGWGSHLWMLGRVQTNCLCERTNRKKNKQWGWKRKCGIHSVPFDFFDLSYTSAPPVNNTMSGYVQKEGGAKKSAGQRAEGVTQKPHDRNALWVISNTHKRWLIWAPVDSHIYLYSIIRRGVGGIQWQRAGLHDRTVHEDIVYECVCFDKAAPELQRELLSFATCSSKNTEI